MSFLFTCPHCGTKTRVAPQYSGHEGRCVTCDGTIELPDFAADADESSDAKGNASWIRLTVATLICLLLVGCLLFTFVRLGGQTLTTLANGRNQTASMQNLAKIASALNNYAADYGTYPPSVTKDAAGTPLHSWRVLLLPYLDEQALYNEIDLNSPWDSVANQDAVQYNTPAVYLHPESSPYTSSGDYFLVTGPRTLFPASGPLGPQDVTDDPTQTILVCEGTPSTPLRSWAEPFDLDITLMQGLLTNLGGNEMGGLTTGGAAVATTDARGHFLNENMMPVTVMSLLTPQGGERLASDTLD